MDAKFLSIKEFAAILCVSPSTVRRAIAYGRIHGFRCGMGKTSSYRIPETEIQRMMSFDLIEVSHKMTKKIE